MRERGLFESEEDAALEELLDADAESRRITAGPVASWDWEAMRRSLSRLSRAWARLDAARDSPGSVTER